MKCVIADFCILVIIWFKKLAETEEKPERNGAFLRLMTEVFSTNSQNWGLTSEVVRKLWIFNHKRAWTQESQFKKLPELNDSFELIEILYTY